MKYGIEVDYFDVISSDAGETDVSGLSLQGFAAGQGQPASAKEQVYLRLYGSTKPPASVDYVQGLDYTTDTVWSLKTNGYGKSQIYTQKYFLDDKNVRQRTVWYLARDDKHQSKLTVVKIPDKDKNGNKDKIKGIVARTFWGIDMVAAPDADPESERINACLCTLKHDSNYVALESDAHTKVPKRLLTTDDTDEVARVMWNEMEATSSGYQWRVHPALDTKFYELVTKRGPDEGSIRMKPRVKAPRMAKTRFTVTSTARISGQSFHATSDVNISVVDAKDMSGTDG
ncbi:hypothetical protein MAJ_09123, partial [Metarhizium majus ARSEF 297]